MRLALGRGSTGVFDDRQERSPQQVPASGESLINADAVWLGDPKLGVPFFSELSDPERGHAALYATREQCAANTTAIARGNRSGNLFILWSGFASASENSAGESALEASCFLSAHGRLSEGAFSGAQNSFSTDTREQRELILLDGSSANLSTHILEPCTLLVINRERCLDLLSHSPRLLAKLFAAMPRDVRALNAQ